MGGWCLLSARREARDPGPWVAAGLPRNDKHNHHHRTNNIHDKNKAPRSRQVYFSAAVMGIGGTTFETMVEPPPSPTPHLPFPAHFYLCVCVCVCVCVRARARV